MLAYAAHMSKRMEGNSQKENSLRSSLKLCCEFGDGETGFEIMRNEMIKLLMSSNGKSNA